MGYQSPIFPRCFGTLVLDPDVYEAKVRISTKLTFRRCYSGAKGRSIVFLACAGPATANNLNDDYHGVAPCLVGYHHAEDEGEATGGHPDDPVLPSGMLTIMSRAAP